MTNQISFASHGQQLWDLLEWEPSCKQLNEMLKVQKCLRNWNKRLNLTRLVEGEDYWIAQIFDSLWPLKAELTNPKKPRLCIDVGSGCGFPGFAVAIALPGAKVTLIDSSTKKAKALDAIANEIGLSSRINVRAERIELTGQNKAFRGIFDLAMARAVSTAPVVAEYLVPLINPTGEALLYLGRWGKNDEIALSKSLIPLKANLKSLSRKTLPCNRGERHQLRLQAAAPCPKNFPRGIGIPTKNPLHNQMPDKGL